MEKLQDFRQAYRSSSHFIV